MKTNLFILFAALCILCGCSSARKAGSSAPEQGITGQITEVSGNQMPRPGRERPKPKGLKTTVFIYEPTNTNQVRKTENPALYTAIGTKQVASVETDSTGNFHISLPPGSYSLFIKYGTQFYANLFDQFNNIALFTVEAGKLTEANLKVTLNATF